MNFVLSFLAFLIVSFLTSVSSTKEEFVENLFSKKANIFLINSKYDSAFLYYNHAVNEFEKEKNYSGVAVSLNRLGEIQSIKGNNNLALEYLEKSRANITKHFGNLNELLAQCNDITGDAFRDISDIETARRYYEESLRIRIKLYGENDSRTAYSYSELGSYFSFIHPDGFDSAFYYCKKALNICRLYPKHNQEIPLERIYSNYAYNYKVSQRDEHNWKLLEATYDTTLMYFDSTLLIIRKKYPPNSYFEATVLHQIGNCYTDRNLYYDAKMNIVNEYFKKAKSYYETDLRIKKSILGEHNKDISITYYTLSILHDYTFKNTKVLVSINYQNKAIEALLPGFKFKNAFETPVIDSCIDPYLLNVLMRMRATYFKLYYETNPSNELTQSIHDNNKCRITLWYRTLSSFKSSDVGQINFIWNGYLFEDAAQSAYNLFLANNDSTLLKEIYSYSEMGKNTELMKHYFVSSNKISGIQSIKYDYVIPIEQLQSNMKEDEAIIEFMLHDFGGGKNNFTLVILKNSLNVIFVPSSEEIVGQTQTLFQAMKGSNVQQFISSSFQIYNATLKDALSLLPKSIKHITVVPDKRYSIIPFEALLEDTSGTNTDFRHLHYFGNKYSISYSLSATIDEVLKKKKSNKTETITGFAPSFSTLSSLPFSQALLKDLKDKISGNYYFNENASIQKFKINCGPSSVIHLATHAVADIEHPENSKLYFCSHDTSRKNYISLDEIYPMKINADLAVISACETSVGREFYAEGLKSFARAFAYAGCKSTVTTLWKVDDKATSMVLGQFYEGLLKGKSKDIALHKAKLDYLVNCKTSEEANPFYWSGIVLTGDCSFIPLKKKTTYLYYSIALLIIAIGGIIVINRRRWNNYNSKD